VVADFTRLGILLVTGGLLGDGVTYSERIDGVPVGGGSTLIPSSARLALNDLPVIGWYGGQQGGTSGRSLAVLSESQYGCAGPPPDVGEIVDAR
jgi:hypothetical protein